ncbi:tRNA (adenosine(37)-N6)-threonylcarbamoyltransferase complex ATPase subunit type 1 TsaE [Pseudozobellia sp. WGM2]|uniref:tRNA (adenosine(37)-N6)-threonylcarbamoyltransferase complex ATPase subunit type 1 TsaE n=1 Tax=Pseudozobellia sp. WGM2 TaxID=2787625 RepID=UPI001ADFA104|nr:tRNA (adenosine(37)-N6)-threonylcarbamoyltransferase complex ATPase subunit type 1 TsaE [Pseudozobellia sp. WGM2]
MNVVYKESQLPNIARQLLNESKSKTITFFAPMGAGKTTLIKSLVQELGGKDTGSSPTFGIVNEYHNEQDKLLAYHFDFYRLNDEMEALDLGLEDYLNQDCYVFIEWPEKIENLIPADCQKVIIEVMDTHTRRIRLI